MKLDDEEKNLLDIVLYEESEIRMLAFKKLIRIYREKDENIAIFSFLETIDQFSETDLNVILENIFDFLVPNSIHCKRVENLLKNEKIMKILVKFLDYPLLWYNSLLVLNVICTLQGCTKEVLDKVIFVFLNSGSENIGRLCLKIVGPAIKNEIWPDKEDFVKFKNKMTSFQADFSDILEHGKLYKVDDYIEDLKKRNVDKIGKIVDVKYFLKNKSMVEARIDELAKIYQNILINGDNESVILALEHAYLVLENLPVYKDKFSTKVYRIQLLRLSDSKNNEIRFLAIKILGRFIFSHSEPGNE